MIDSNIPLSYHPPEVASPMQTIGGLMQLRSQITENALRNAQVEMSKQHAAEYQAEAAQKNLENQSVHKLSEMFADPAAQAEFAKGNYDRIWSAGISPNVANTAIKNHIDMRTSMASNKTADLVRAHEGRTAAEDLFKSVLVAPKEDIPSIYASGRSNVIKLFPEFSGNLPEFIPAGEEGVKAIRNIQAANGTLWTAMGEEIKRREAESTLGKTEAERKKIEAETPGIAAASGQKVTAADASHLLTATDQASYDALRGELPLNRAKLFPDVFDPAKIRNAALTPEESKPKVGEEVPFPKDVEAQKARLAAAGRAQNTFAIGPAELKGATADDKLAAVPPAERSTVQGILSGRIPIPNSRSGSPTAYGNQLRRWATQIDPDWTDQRNKLWQEFNSNQTKTGQSLQSANTLIGHLGTLYDLTHELNANGGNTNSQTVNALVRRVQQELGNPKITNVQSALQAVANESERLYVGGVGSEQGRAEFQKALNTAVQSPQQAEGQIHTAVKLLGSRVKATRIPFDRMMKKYGEDVTFFSPEAKATLVEMGLNPQDVEFGKSAGKQAAAGTIRARDPQGKLHEAPAGTPLPAGWKAE